MKNPSTHPGFRDVQPADVIQDALDEASDTHPSIDLKNGYSLHVCGLDGGWQVWLNTEVSDFDGLCIGSGFSKLEAIQDAVAVLETALDRLQWPINE